MQWFVSCWRPQWSSSPLDLSSGFTFQLKILSHIQRSWHVVSISIIRIMLCSNFQASPNRLRDKWPGPLALFEADEWTYWLISLSFYIKCGWVKSLCCDMGSKWEEKFKHTHTHTRIMLNIYLFRVFSRNSGCQFLTCLNLLCNSRSVKLSQSHNPYKRKKCILFLPSFYLLTSKSTYKPSKCIRAWSLSSLRVSQGQLITFITSLRATVSHA